MLHSSFQLLLVYKSEDQCIIFHWVISSVKMQGSMYIFFTFHKQTKSIVCLELIKILMKSKLIF